MATSQRSEAGEYEHATTGSVADPRRARMRAEVRAGLTRTPRTLPSKYFYDERGSRLFERITELPEYYLTRAERALLESHADELVERIRPRTLVELGAGSAAKSRILLDAMAAAEIADLYVPIDVSGEFLEATAARLREEYPGLEVRPVVSDISVALDAPDARPRPTLFAFLGSTVGNFDSPGAIALLRRVRAAMAPDDRCLLGVDLVKDRERLEAAYDDAQGVTAAFNRNVLRVLNRELGADFDPDAFDHRARYDAGLRRVELLLVPMRDQTVTIPGVGEIALRADEPIRTEISCKYTHESVDELLTASRLRRDRWWAAPSDEFALALAAPR
ncbi:MAG: L-histidine N(alpha)-methyltransferase [Gemmatimonadota bacterium]